MVMRTDWSPLTHEPELGLDEESERVNRLDLRATHAGRRRNGMPGFVPYVHGGDTARDEEVAALVAAARAEALRRARERLGPGPLERQASDRRWEPCGEEGGKA